MFNTTQFRVSANDGRNFTLLEAVQYESPAFGILIAPVGSTTDGASTPTETWAVIPPFGKYWPAAALHDFAYRNQLIRPDGTKANLPKEDCDALLMEAMSCLGVGELEAKVIYDAVVLAGEHSFEKDRS